MAGGVGVMKDKELKLEESGVSHTLGAAGEGRKVVCKGEGARGKCRCYERVDAISAVRYT